MSFSEKLIEARKRACLSQQHLSRLSGVSQQAISKLENGKSSPSEYTMRQLAAALHIPLSELIDENKEEMDETDWLMQDVLHRIHRLSEPALTRLSDFLTGLEANRSIAVSEHENEKNSRIDEVQPDVKP